MNSCHGLEDETCTTRQNEKGFCKPLKNCSALYKLATHRPISLQTHHLLLERRCGFHDLLPSVCCLEPVEEYTSCKTPFNQPGTCKPLNVCPTLLKLIKRNMSQEDRQILKKSSCGTLNGAQHFCCPATSCETPNDIEGFCVPDQECPEIAEMIKKSSAQPENIAFVKEAKRICSSQNDEHLVCCANEQSVKLPKPPVCGFQTDSYIIGGSETGIEEHPWTALLMFGSASTNHLCGGSLISSRYVLTGKQT